MAWFKPRRAKQATSDNFTPPHGGRPSIDREEAWQLYQTGLSLREVALAMHVSRSAVQRAVTLHQPAQQPRTPHTSRITPNTRFGAINLRNQGLTYRQIAAQLNISPSTAFRLCRPKTTR